MSRIFEALKQSSTATSDAIMDVLSLAQLDSEIEVSGPPAQELALPAETLADTPLIEIIDNAALAKYSPPTILHRYQAVSLRLTADVPVFPFDGSDPRTSEQYRTLRTNLLHHPVHPNMVVISSAASGDGKTLTALNTAGALAIKTDEQVLVLDGDLRRSSVAKILGISNPLGFTDVLRGTCSLDDAIVRVAELPNLHVLTAGTPSPNPVELLDSAVWKALAVELRHLFNYVIIDSPPVAAVADFDLLQDICDGVVIVVRPDHTNRKAWKKALDTIPKEKFLGIVINAVEDWFLWNAQDGYYCAERQNR